MRTKELKSLKIGSEVRTWCAGCEVIGEVIELNQSGFIVSHDPVNWGNDVYTKTQVKESTPLQKMFYSDTTPYSELIN